MNDKTKARCHHCKATKGEHVGDDRACPDGSGQRFKHPVSLSRVSASFSADEVAVLDTVLKGLPVRADLRGLARNPALSSVARKLQGMRATLKQRAVGE